MVNNMGKALYINGKGISKKGIWQDGTIIQWVDIEKN